jgi:uncharacterized SAM-binding protein YcdF (DUF218 family)
MPADRTAPRRRSRALIALAILAVVLLVAAAFAGTALVETTPIDAPQAIISLGSHEWERFPTTVQLSKQYPDAIVLITQPLVPSPVNCHLCGERLKWLAALGVDSNHALILPMKVQNTYDEARAARAYCEAHGIRRLAVVTSPYHTRRALATFRTVFRGTPMAIGMYAATESPARPGTWWATPYDRFYVRYEWAAVVWNAFRHGIIPLAGAS